MVDSAADGSLRPRRRAHASRRTRATIFAAVACTTLHAEVCGATQLSAVDNAGIEESARAFGEAVLANDDRQAERVLGDRDRDALLEILEELRQYLGQMLADYGEVTSVRATTSDDEPVVRIVFRVPDTMLESAIGRMLSSGATAVGKPPPRSRDLYPGAERCVAAPSGWCVVRDHHRLKARIELGRSLSDLSSELRAIGYDDNAVERHSKLEKAEEGLAKATLLFEAYRERFGEDPPSSSKQEYEKLVERVARLNFGKQVKGVFGAIVNAGARSLDTVVLKVDLLRDDGSIVAQREIRALLTTRGEAFLGPGQQADFGLKVDAPADWAEGVEGRVAWLKLPETEVGPWTIPPERDAAFSVTVTPDRLNARSGPGTEFAVVGSFFRGDSLEVLAEDGEWLRIHTPCHGAGYVASKFVKRRGT